MTQKILNLILKKVKCILGKGKTSESKFSHIGEKNYKEKKEKLNLLLDNWTAFVKRHKRKRTFCH